MTIRSLSLRGACLTALLLAAAGPAAADEPKTLVFAKDSPHAATLTLLPLAGQIGRDRPFYNGYRPQLRFAGLKDDVTCALKLPEPREKVEPGETADLSATCLDTLRLREDRLEFGVYEGGRQVGRGRLKPGG
ncbi:MAG: hypothetical protein ACK44A_11880 [Roseateles sp.]